MDRSKYRVGRGLCDGVEGSHSVLRLWITLMIPKQEAVRDCVR